MANDYQDFLAHHGVKGMRWGYRKDEYKQAVGKITGLNNKRKEGIRQKALEENEQKIRVNEQELKNWQNEAKRLKNAKSQYLNEEDWKRDVAFAIGQAKRSRNRVEAWTRREKRLMSMDVSKLSARQVKKSTKLKWHEFAYPDE